VVDLNPLHWISKANHAFGDTMASGLEFLGITDPAVDPDGVREIAKHWRALAKGLDEASHAAELSLTDVTWEGETAKAFSKRARTMRKHATDMAHSLRDGATALDKFADEAHELITQIGVMIAEIAEFEIAGLALSVLTAGLSEVASTLVAGERALKVIALVARIEEEGGALGATVRTVMEAVRNVERALKALKDIKTVAKVGKLAGEGVKFTAFTTALEDPGAFKDPTKLATLLTEGAVAGVGLGFLGKALGKGLKALKPGEIADLAKALKLNGSGLSRLKLRPSEWEKLPASIRGMFKECKLDPIDVATGDMLLPQTDVQLPGTLPLILQRTHVSSYRWGGWFGPSWASTLDQRVQVDDEGIIYTAPDGARLTFPYPDPDPDPDSHDPVYPETGSRLALTWDTETDGGLRITDPDTGLAYLFHTPQPTNDVQAIDLPLQAIVDRNNQRITLHYTDHGTPTEVTHTGGYRIALDHHPTQPRITALRLLGPHHPNAPGTTLLTYGYNPEGHLTDVTNSSALPLRFTYDTDGRITSWTDRNNTTYTYTYDTRGRVIRTHGTDGYLSGTLAYNDTTHTTTVTNSLGHTTVYEHNDAYRLIRETNPLGHTTHQQWDEQHHLTCVTDALGHTFRYTYDIEGRPTSLMRPDGHETRTEYNGLGLPTAVTGFDHALWLHEYDGRGNRTAVTDPAGAPTYFAYDRMGQLISVTDALGQSTRVRCNGAGLPVEITDPVGASTRFERDTSGRTVAVTDPLGATTSLKWTAEGQLTRRAAPDGTTESWSYDGEGNLTTHTDAMGADSHFDYTHFDLLAVRTGPDGVQHTFGYDTELRLTQVTNPQGLSWTYDYDPAGHLISERDFDDRTLRYVYDAAGHLTLRTNALGQHIHYVHDALGRITRKDMDGAVTDYCYDPVGRLTQATSPSATIALNHDSVGRLLSETINGRILTNAYDIVGRRSKRTTPTGAASAWTYDPAGRPATLLVGGRTLAFNHDAAGHELSRHIGNTLTMTHTFDDLGRLTSQAVKHTAKISTDAMASQAATGSRGTAARTVQERNYTYRSDGNVIGLREQLNGPRTFDLDTTGRVTAVNAPHWTERYAYDGAGNQIEATWPAHHPGHEASGSRAYTGTRVTRAGSVRYEHDAAGRITLRQKTRLSRKPDTWRYTWDAEDRLTTVTIPDGTVWRYQYDPIGRRTAKQRLSFDNETVLEHTDFTWDNTTLCEQTTRSAELPNPVTLTWDHHGQQPLSQTERITASDTSRDEIDRRFFAIVTDLIGTPNELVDEQGHVAWRARSTLWGITTWTADSTAHTPLRFPGQYFDAESELHYNYYRHYDPETARYLSPDPLGLTPAPSPITYVHNPITWADPLGLAPERCKEVILDSFARFEQARNKALELLGKIDPATRQSYFGRLETAESTYEKKVGFTTTVDGVFKRFRLDFDPAKGPHINVEVGKGASAKKWAVPWNGTEADLKKILRRNT
jgi:RHS repeat-associated protein